MKYFLPLSLALCAAAGAQDIDLAPGKYIRWRDGTVATRYMGLKGPTGIAASFNLTLPIADGTNGQALTTNGAGQLGFTTIAGGSISDGDKGNIVVSTVVTPGDTWSLDTTSTLTNSILDSVTGGAVQGNILYRGVTGWLPLAPGTAGQFLQTAGAGANPLWATASGSGNVSNTGTPLNNQVAIWTAATTLEGDPDLTFDGTTLGATAVTATDGYVGSLLFEGSTVDGTNIFSITATNPTAPRSGNLPDLSIGDFLGTTGAQTVTNKSISGAANTITNVPAATALSGQVPVANGGTGTASPGLVAGTNITSITGTWPNQTINASGGGSSPTLASMRTTPPIIWDEFFANGTVATSRFGQFGWTGNTSTGTVVSWTSNTTLNNTNGGMELTSGNVASTSYGCLNSSTTGIMFNVTSPTAAYTFETRVLIKSASLTQSAGVDEYTVRIGFIDSANQTAPTDGAYFSFSAADTEWQINTVSNTSNASTADTGVTVVEDTWYRLAITVDATGSSIGFSINGTATAGSPLTNTTNIPRAVNRSTGLGYNVIKGAGSTGGGELWIDYAALETIFGSSR